MKLLYCSLLLAVLYFSRNEVFGLPVDEDNIDDGDDEELKFDEDEEAEEEEELGPIPEFTVSGQTFTVRVGDGVRLPCEVDDLGKHTTLWKREEGEILTAGGILVTRDPRISLDNGSIVISPINYNDSGNYICQLASNPPKQIVHVLDILRPPSVQPVPANGQIEVPWGSPVSLECQTGGNPIPNVTWTRLEKKKFADGKLTEVGPAITLFSADRHHTGVYQCTASNGYGDPVSADISLVVTYKPMVRVEKLFIRKVEYSYDVEISCDAHGEPKPNVSWKKNGLRLRSPDEHHVGSKHVLSIKSMQLADFANYSCVAGNKLGQHEETIEITGLPEPIVLLGNRSVSHGVELEWRTESLTPISEYRLHYSAAGHPHQEETIQSSSNKSLLNIYSHVHRLENLHPGKTYEISIEARNTFGWSRLSKFLVTSSPEGLESADSHNSELKGSSLHDSKAMDSGSGSPRECCWWICIATLVLYLKQSL